MADSPFGIGSEIEVTPFLHTTPLVVKILSAESFDHGGSAKIFKGLAKVPYRPYEVALKVISHVVSKDRSELVRRELEIVTKLAERSMRRILPFIGTASVGFHPIIVTEYMKNGNMVQYFQKNPTVDRQNLLVQVAEAVYWLHDFKNMVHGDLKCENVLINDDREAVLADFGLSTLIEQEASSVTTCTDIRNMNTFRFAAPELLGLVEQPDAATRQRSKTPQGDVYAFGMLVLQAFIGRHPWPDLIRAESVFLALMSRKVHPRPVGDAIMQAGLTDSWWNVCCQCWQYEPDKRPTMHRVWDTLTLRENQQEYAMPMRYSSHFLSHREKRPPYPFSAPLASVSPPQPPSLESHPIRPVSPRRDHDYIKQGQASTPPQHTVFLTEQSWATASEAPGASFKIISQKDGDLHWQRLRRIGRPQSPTSHLPALRYLHPESREDEEAYTTLPPLHASYLDSIPLHVRSSNYPPPSVLASELNLGIADDRQVRSTD